MSIINESCPNYMHVGAACSNEKNQVFTVIGFSEKDYTQAKNKPQDLEFSLEFDPANSKRFVYGLYYDPNSPERQEIIDVQSRSTKFVRDINDVLLLNAAKNSPFYDPEIVRHFLSILQGKLSCELSFTQQLLRNYIVRGINNMVQILHNKYLQVLGEAGLSKEILAFIVKGASASLTLSKDAVKTTII